MRVFPVMDSRLLECWSFILETLTSFNLLRATLAQMSTAASQPHFQPHFRHWDNAACVCLLHSHAAASALAFTKNKVEWNGVNFVRPPK